MLPSQTNESKRNKVLFDFYSIVDKRLSIIMGILKHHFEEDKATEILNMMLENDINGISDMKKAHMENFLVRDIYARVMDFHIAEKEYLQYSVLTSMKVLLEEYIKTNGLIKPVVLCENQTQVQFIKNTFPKATCILGDKSSVNTSGYTRIIAGSIEDIEGFKDPTMVDFVILNYRENFIDDNYNLDPVYIIKYGDVNSFTIATAHVNL